jgi:hypothetical protein
VRLYTRVGIRNAAAMLRDVQEGCGRPRAGCPHVLAGGVCMSQAGSSPTASMGLTGITRYVRGCGAQQAPVRDQCKVVQDQIESKRGAVVAPQVIREVGQSMAGTRPACEPHASANFQPYQTLIHGKASLDAKWSVLPSSIARLRHLMILAYLHPRPARFVRKNASVTIR